MIIKWIKWWKVLQVFCALSYLLFLLKKRNLGGRIMRAFYWEWFVLIIDDGGRRWRFSLDERYMCRWWFKCNFVFGVKWLLDVNDSPAWEFFMNFRPGMWAAVLRFVSCLLTTGIAFKITLSIGICLSLRAWTRKKEEITSMWWFPPMARQPYG